MGELAEMQLTPGYHLVAPDYPGFGHNCHNKGAGFVSWPQRVATWLLPSQGSSIREATDAPVTRSVTVKVGGMAPFVASPHEPRPPSVPTGNGQGNTNFFVDFALRHGTEALPVTFSPVAPLGDLVYQGS
jgi:hypothetical protein